MDSGIFFPSVESESVLKLLLDILLQLMLRFGLFNLSKATRFCHCFVFVYSLLLLLFLCTALRDAGVSSFYVVFSLVKASLLGSPMVTEGNMIRNGPLLGMFPQTLSVALSSSATCYCL